VSLCEADVLSISCPLTSDTHHLINAEWLSLMKPGAFLINTACGPIVDQASLTRALQEQRIAGAGLEVFETEAPAADEPLLALDNVIVTPHALSWTDQCFAELGVACVRAVHAVMRGSNPASVVNPDVPTMKEIGVNVGNYSLFGSIVGPKGMPKDVVAKLEKACREAVNAPAFKDFLEKQKLPFAYRGAEDIGGHLRASYNKMGEVISTTGIKIDRGNRCQAPGESRLPCRHFQANRRTTAASPYLGASPLR